MHPVDDCMCKGSVFVLPHLVLEADPAVEDCVKLCIARADFSWRRKADDSRQAVSWEGVSMLVEG
jgi:hypothetical protein